MTKILLISWSPKKWNTYTTLSYIAKSLPWEKELILLKDKNIKHCIWCWHCGKHLVCAIKDDMQDISKKLSEADTIILWSPNYFANVTWMTKIFIDRLLPLYHTQSLKKKNIFLIMPWSSLDIENKKYLLQGTYWLIEYQNMNLLWIYGLETENAGLIQGKIERITKHILNKLAK